MRTLVLFVLTVGAVAAVAGDASAFGKRKKKADPCCPTPVVVAPSGCCGSSGYPGAYSPYPGAYGTYPSAPYLMPGAPQPGTVVVPATMPPKK